MQDSDNSGAEAVNNPVAGQDAGQAPASDATPPAADTGGDTPPPAPEWKLPPEFEKASWAAKVKSQEDVYKLVDNLNSAIGKKAIVPTEETHSPEEVERYYNEMLRPKDIEAYTLPTEEEGYVPSGFEQDFKTMAHEAGLSPRQWSIISQKFNEFGQKQYEASIDPNAFAQQFQETFKTKDDSFRKQLDSFIVDALGEQTATEIFNMPNEAALHYYKTMDAIRKKFGAQESGLPANSQPSSPTQAKSLSDQRGEIREKLIEANNKGDWKTAETLQKQLIELANQEVKGK